MEKAGTTQSYTYRRIRLVFLSKQFKSTNFDLHPCWCHKYNQEKALSIRLNNIFKESAYLLSNITKNPADTTVTPETV